ncbi:MAG: AraC family transcriptional regulator [Betaproteobacteria bacterium]|nr:AraC family transcriptional regulator [Betaproteobacteria bacterium]
MTSTTLTLDQFRSLMMAAGYDEVVERHWAPGTELDTHTHSFEANAIVVQGQMWLGEPGGAQRHLKVGDTFHLAPEIPHSERYCPIQGATYWVARKDAVAAPSA